MGDVSHAEWQNSYPTLEEKLSAFLKNKFSGDKLSVAGVTKIMFGAPSIFLRAVAKKFLASQKQY